MGEGVDPTQMCRSLVEKVSQSEQLRAVTDPDILVLFEDWMEELEEEVIEAVKIHGSTDPKSLASELGLSVRGTNFFLSKLKREGRL